MSDFETRLSIMLKDATPDPPLGLTLDSTALTKGRRPAHVLLRPAGAAAAVLLIACIVAALHPRQPTHSDAGHAALNCASQPTHYHAASGDNSIPQPTPVIVGDRLLCPFSISDGQIRFTPIPASYRPTITSVQALATLTDTGNRPPEYNGPPLFLAYLTADLPPSTLRPVWVSLLYEPDPIIGGIPVNPSTVHSLPLNAPSPLADAIDTIDAQTGKFASGTNVAAPDQPGDRSGGIRREFSDHAKRGPGR
jgi:hypothetical protein